MITALFYIFVAFAGVWFGRFLIKDARTGPAIPGGILTIIAILISARSFEMLANILLPNFAEGVYWLVCIWLAAVNYDQIRRLWIK